MSRLADFVVALRQDSHPPENPPFPDSQICHKHRGYPGAGETITVMCHPAMTMTLARYVYVYLEGGDCILTLCEVEVYGDQGWFLIRDIWQIEADPKLSPIYRRFFQIK